MRKSYEKVAGVRYRFSQAFCVPSQFRKMFVCASRSPRPAGPPGRWCDRVSHEDAGRGTGHCSPHFTDKLHRFLRKYHERPAGRSVQDTRIALVTIRLPVMGRKF